MSSIESFSMDYLGHIAWRPPSMGSVTPVENEASSDAKKAIAAATSSGSPGLPRAWVCLLRSKNWKEHKMTLVITPDYN